MWSHKTAFSGRSCQVYLITGGLRICAEVHMCVSVCMYLLFKTDIQAKNQLLMLVMCCCGLMPVSGSAVPLHTEAIPCFDNITFRFHRTTIGFMYVSYSSF